jgi:hypothetical protein
MLAMGCAAKLDPLPIKEVEPGKPATLDQALAAAGGNLNLARNGKSRLPYVTGLDGGCVAGTIALALVWLPLDVLLGGHLMPPGGGDCEHRLPSFVIVQLESRHAAVLVVQKYGDFVAQLPPGTYLVVQMTDDKDLVNIRFGFQIPSASHAYDLGVIAIDDGSLPRANITAHDEAAFVQLMSQLPGAGSLPRSTALFVQISSARDAQSQQVYFVRKENLDAYLTAATNELKDHGMPLLTSVSSTTSTVPPAAPQTASAGVQASAPSAAVGPIDVPFKIDYGAGVAEGVAQLENGQLIGQASNGGRSITLKGKLKDRKLSIEIFGAVVSNSHASFGSGNYCSGQAQLDNAAGPVHIPLPVTCGPNNFLDSVYLELPST